MYRREANAAHEKDNLGACDANFFDTKNEAAKNLREEVAMMALRDALNWLNDDEGRVDGNTRELGKVGMCVVYLLII